MLFIIGTWLGFILGMLFCGFARSGSAAIRNRKSDLSARSFAQASLTGLAMGMENDHRI